MSLSPPPPIVEQDAPNGLNPALKSDSEPSEPIDEPMQLDSPGKAAIKEEDPEAQLVKVAQAKQRHEDDLKKHHYEPPQAERVQDDWQVAYTWAFIVKFKQLERIRKLECLDDFERCLTEPVANRPDDVLEGILVRFLGNLKPGLRNLDCTNIQHHLSNYIHDMLLNSTEFTVWDRPWAPNEEARSSCCSDSDDRKELGRLRYIGEPLEVRANKNPLKQIEQRGGGLFELDWRERAKLLRQMVDWQLTHADNIRAIINKHHKFSTAAGKKAEANAEEMDIRVEPAGQDRGKNRIWAFDPLGRLYKSGNPFKRPCPLFSLTATRADYATQLEKYKAHGDQKPGKLKGSRPKGKATSAEASAHRKLLKGIEDEKNLAVALEGLIPEIEKEEARVLRQRRKVVAAAELAQQAELRATRTRRSNRKVDYTYESDDFDDEPRKRRRGPGGEDAYDDANSRAVIPGERASARVRARGAAAGPNGTDNVGTNGHSTPLSVPEDDLASVISDAAGTPTVDIPPSKGQKKVKGYAWIEETVPLAQLNERERKAYFAQQDEQRERAENGEGSAIDASPQRVDEDGPSTRAEGSAAPMSDGGHETNGIAEPIVVDD